MGLRGLLMKFTAILNMYGNEKRETFSCKSQALWLRWEGNTYTWI